MEKIQRYDIVKLEERKLFARITVLYNEYCKGNESVFNQLERLRADYDEVYKRMLIAKEEANNACKADLENNSYNEKMLSA